MNRRRLPPCVPARGRPRGARGFTLLEILVSMVILAVVLLAVHGLHAQSLAAIRTARFQALAPLLARQKLSEVEISGRVAPGVDEGSFGERYPGYAWRVELGEAASERLGEVAGGLRRIDLSVSFNSEEFVYRVRAYRFFQE